MELQSEKLIVVRATATLRCQASLQQPSPLPRRAILATSITISHKSFVTDYIRMPLTC